MRASWNAPDLLWRKKKRKLKQYFYILTRTDGGTNTYPWHVISFIFPKSKLRQWPEASLPPSEWERKLGFWKIKKIVGKYTTISQTRACLLGLCECVHICASVCVLMHVCTLHSFYYVEWWRTISIQREAHRSRTHSVNKVLKASEKNISIFYNHFYPFKISFLLGPSLLAPLFVNVMIGETWLFN